MKRQQTLATRVLRAVFALYLTVAVLLTTGQLTAEYRIEQRRLDRDITSAAHTFSEVLTQALWNIDSEQIEAALQGLLGVNDDVISVALYDPAGAPLHVFQSPAAGTAAVKYLPFLKRGEDAPLYRRFTYRWPLTHESEYSGTYPLGTLVITSDSHVVLNRAAVTFMLTVLGAAIKTALLWGLFYWLMRAMVARPLAQITGAMRALGPAATESARIDPELLARTDELGLMSRSFAQMDAALRSHQADLEAKIRERTEQLERAAAARSIFLATMSHEIRTPMNGVIGMAQLLSTTDLDPRQAQYVSAISSSSQVLIEIINSVLDHLKIDAGKMVLERTDFDLQQVFDDCLTSVAYSAQQSGLELVGRLPVGQPTSLVGDPIRLRQIILNLLNNAVKFTLRGEVVLRVQYLAVDADRCQLRLSVTDSGIGIEAGACARLFQPFSQADSSTTRRFGGSGLGLAICRQLAELMGGTIEVESEPEVGSKFWVDLPFALAPGAAPRRERPFEGLRLQLCCPGPTLAAALTEVLTAWGAEVHPAEAELARAGWEEAEAAGQPLELVVADVAALNGLSQVTGTAPPLLALGVTDGECHWPARMLTLAKPVTNRVFKAALANLLRPAPVAAAAPSGAPSYAHVTVLVAEDNSVNWLVIEGLLQLFAVRPLWVENGAEALAFFQAGGRADLVLMDGEMPVLDGWEASRHIRALPGLASNGRPATIVGVSAHAGEWQRERAAAAGMDGFLGKPYRVEQIRDLLAEVDSKVRAGSLSQ